MMVRLANPDFGNVSVAACLVNSQPIPLGLEQALFSLVEYPEANVARLMSRGQRKAPGFGVRHQQKSRLWRFVTGSSSGLGTGTL